MEKNKKYPRSIFEDLKDGLFWRERRVIDLADNLFWGESRNIDHWRQRKALEETGAFVESNLPMADSFPSRYAIYDHVAKFIANRDGMICEFGVAGGKSINHLARLLPNRRIYGFDSFNGLPEDWRFNTKKGAFKLPALPEVASNVELVRGLFDQSLPAFLANHKEDILYLHIDCDLYSSTRTVFELVGPRIHSGTVLVFDEFFNYPGWQQGEFKAFMEYVETTGMKFEYLGYAKMGTQVAIRIL